MRKHSYIFIAQSIAIAPAIAVLLLASSLLQANEKTIEADDFWVREVPPVSSVTAAFGTLRSQEKDELISATSSIARVVEIHTSASIDGISHMRKLNSITLPADTTLELLPGGAHIMFIGLKKPLQKGDIVDITLTFSSGYSLLVHAPVRASLGAHDHTKHH